MYMFNGLKVQAFALRNASQEVSPMGEVFKSSDGKDDLLHQLPSQLLPVAQRIHKQNARGGRKGGYTSVQQNKLPSKLTELPLLSTQLASSKNQP